MLVCIALTPISLLGALDGTHGLYPATKPAAETLWPLQRDLSLFQIVGAQTPDAVSKVPVTTAALAGYCPWQGLVFQRGLWHHDSRRGIGISPWLIRAIDSKRVNLISSKVIGRF